MVTWSRVLLAGACLAVSTFSLQPRQVAATEVAAAATVDPSRQEMDCTAATGPDGTVRRTVCADIAALDHTLVYNRFGSFDPFGMIFALKRDLSSSGEEPAKFVADQCDTVTGAEEGIGPLSAGKVRLKDCKRARPLVLRANVGDILRIRITNYLTPDAPDFSHDFCRGDLADSAEKRAVRSAVSEGTHDEVEAGVVACPSSTESGDEMRGPSTEWPTTRGLSFAIQGLVLVPGVDPAANRACLGLQAFAPGELVTCSFEIDREGTYFLSSKAAPSGGEGNGGSITHGLFGAVVAEKAGTAWYRSQVNVGALNAAWQTNGQGCEAAGTLKPHARLCQLDYDHNYAAESPDAPELRITKEVAPGVEKIVHSDLNAIIYRAAGPDPAKPEETREEVNFREFSVFFHDELKSFYTRNYEELAQFGQLAGVRDGFAINYGASGMGTMLLANRKGIGPANDCTECLYEEFFLQSWANGDPALLEQFPDDPSNVHHSYLNDKIVFRNFHAGPKETHVFHLHAHQWFAGNDRNRGAYLDSQTVAPQQGFTYDIYGGGLNGNPLQEGLQPGDVSSWASQGSGNRNRTLGDSIFHCHLYPHFAQGMWELWRVHDVLEDGTRKLPDGQSTPGLSLAERKPEDRFSRRLGSYDAVTGARRVGRQEIGTPVPAIVPLPDRPIPPIPSYASNGDPRSAMPGYPFYIAGKPGHRAPQAPLDIAADKTGRGEMLDGGLPRHVVKDGGVRKLEVEGEAQGEINSEERRASQQQIVAKMLALGNFAGHLEKADLDVIPYDGTDAEKAAMAFHENGSGVTVLDVKGDTTTFDATQGGYRSIASPAANGGTPRLAQSVFHVNGSPARPGAPFADPCGVSAAANSVKLPGGDPLVGAGGDFFADPALIGFRRYEASAIQLNLVTNRAGWHDPQARINVLTTQSPDYKDGQYGPRLPVSPKVGGKEEPFFFRALSGECIEFRHTNELPKDLERDDFQVRTPTDTIGQHIHLVKFDVTSSDGSGNGWNYEDGTFAADEIASRICAYYSKLFEDDPASVASKIKAARPTGEPVVRMPEGFCDDPRTKSKSWWRQRLPDAREHFQTTVQRWFADPILSPAQQPALGTDTAGKILDRTLRTVFTHDHFGPSSIQQHGFYSALLIEPHSSSFCKTDADGQTTCTPTRAEGDMSLVEGNADLVGARAVVVTDPAKDPTHPDYREYALAIADFATLYDPRDFETEAAFIARSEGTIDGSPEGLGTLLCEGNHRGDAAALALYCGSGMFRNEKITSRPWQGGEDTPPAWVAGGSKGGLSRSFTLPDLLANTNELTELRDETILYRKRAAGDPDGDKLAKPVAAPKRPESISVDHHDPYLVNYRGEPIPLRIGTKNANGTRSPDCKLRPIDSFVEALRDAATIAGCSIDRQIAIDPDADPALGASGDMADVFLSAFHDDPVTPIVEAYDGERIVTRLIQGAQEVQHTFTVEGYTFQRNIDQAFSTGRPPLEHTAALNSGAGATLNVDCQQSSAILSGRPMEYDRWRRKGSSDFSGAARDHWERYEKALAACDNVEGLTTAQEVGISEHFEFSGKLRQANPGVEGFKRQIAVNQTTDYFYSFGSVDALWNGAWGLVRIFRDPQARDNSLCPVLATECADKVGSRLPTLASIKLQSGLPQPVRELPAPQRVGAEQILACRKGSPRVHAIIAALQVSHVWPKGTPDTNGDAGTRYGAGLYDRNGLMFALLDPRQLFGADAEAAIEYDPADPSTSSGATHWQNIKLGRVLKAVRDTYIRPEPLTLRINANDCVSLHIINGLVPTGSTGGLLDDRGDAAMPPITPLNVDSDWSSGDEIEEAAEQGSETFTAGKRADVRPSARLGISLPLPSLDYAQSIPLPFGQNLTSTLAPPRCSTGSLDDCVVSLAVSSAAATWPDARFVRRQDSIERQIFYAGRSALSVEFDVLMTMVADRLGESDLISLPADFTVDRKDGPATICEDHVGIPVTLLGRDLILCNPGTGGQFLSLFPEIKSTEAMALARQATAAEWDRAAAELLSGDDVVNWTPYAFGALPLKSTGDVIGHGSHGLFGAVIVEPMGADLAADGRLDIGGRIVLAPRADHTPLWTTTLTTTGLDGVARKQREFVIFYQDGLNLRDTATGNRWIYPGSVARLVAECEVCDDSYDFGDQGANYRSDPFFMRLRGQQSPGQSQPEAQFNLNPYIFPDKFFLPTYKPLNQPLLRAEAGDEIVIRLIHPGGRARQRSFGVLGNDYDDLFPGFGFPHSALLAPGKGVRAALTRKVQTGCYLWGDGTITLNSGGTWGLIDVVPAGSLNDPDVSSCRG